jgi:hypothetical protein
VGIEEENGRYAGYFSSPEHHGSSSTTYDHDGDRPRGALFQEGEREELNASPSALHYFLARPLTKNRTDFLVYLFQNNTQENVLAVLNYLRATLQAKINLLIELNKASSGKLDSNAFDLIIKTLSQKTGEPSENIQAIIESISITPSEDPLEQDRSATLELIKEETLKGFLQLTKDSIRIENKRPQDLQPIIENETQTTETFVGELIKASGSPTPLFDETYSALKAPFSEKGIFRQVIEKELYDAAWFIFDACEINLGDLTSQPFLESLINEDLQAIKEGHPRQTLLHKLALSSHADIDNKKFNTLIQLYSKKMADQSLEMNVIHLRDEKGLTLFDSLCLNNITYQLITGIRSDSLQKLSLDSKGIITPQYRELFRQHSYPEDEYAAAILEDEILEHLLTNENLTALAYQIHLQVDYICSYQSFTPTRVTPLTSRLTAEVKAMLESSMKAKAPILEASLAACITSIQALTENTSDEASLRNKLQLRQKELESKFAILTAVRSYRQARGPIKEAFDQSVTMSEGEHSSSEDGTPPASPASPSTSSREGRTTPEKGEAIHRAMEHSPLTARNEADLVDYLREAFIPNKDVIIERPLYESVIASQIQLEVRDIVSHLERHLISFASQGKPIIEDEPFFQPITGGRILFHRIASSKHSSVKSELMKKLDLLYQKELERQLIDAIPTFIGQNYRIVHGREIHSSLKGLHHVVRDPQGISAIEYLGIEQEKSKQDLDRRKNAIALIQERMRKEVETLNQKAEKSWFKKKKYRALKKATQELSQQFILQVSAIDFSQACLACDEIFEETQKRVEKETKKEGEEIFNSLSNLRSDISALLYTSNKSAPSTPLPRENVDLHRRLTKEPGEIKSYVQTVRNSIRQQGFSEDGIQLLPDDCEAPIYFSMKITENNYTEAEELKEKTVKLSRAFNLLQNHLEETLTNARLPWNKSRIREKQSVIQAFIEEYARTGTADTTKFKKSLEVKTLFFTPAESHASTLADEALTSLGIPVAGT